MSKNLNIDLSPTRHLLLKDGGDEIEDVDWNAIIGSGAQSWPISISKVVKRKLSSYRSQDIRKSRWDEENAITADGVWDMMKERGGCCQYCDREVLLVYRHKRDPRQWSLDRIQNDIGHTRENCVIACLGCNLRRGTEEADFQKAAASMVVRKIEVGEGSEDEGEHTGNTFTEHLPRDTVHGDGYVIRKLDS